MLIFLHKKLCNSALYSYNLKLSADNSRTSIPDIVYHSVEQQNLLLLFYETIYDEIYDNNNNNK